MSLAIGIMPILMGGLAVALLIALPTLIKILMRSAPSGDMLSGDFRPRPAHRHSGGPAAPCP